METASIIAICIAAFTTFAAIVGFVVKALLKSQATRIEEKFRTLAAESVTAVENAKALYISDLKRVEESHEDCKARTEKAISDIFVRMDGLFKEWANFMSQYFKIDTTRSNRLDACFKNMDEMRDTIREIKSMILRKIEECVVDVKKEMKDYVKDRLREKEIENE